MSAEYFLLNNFKSLKKFGNGGRPEVKERREALGSREPNKYAFVSTKTPHVSHCYQPHSETSSRIGSKKAHFQPTIYLLTNQSS